MKTVERQVGDDWQEVAMAPCTLRVLKVAFALLNPALFILGCDDQSLRTVAPTAPMSFRTTSSPIPPNGANWKAIATVVSVTAGNAHACGWGTSVGDTRAGVWWRVIISTPDVSMDEDMPNWPTDDVPYSGHLDGVAFTAGYRSGPDYANYVCQFREASLSGRFSDDFSTFDAVETLVWGQPGAETTVQRHWVGSRL
jgi:hypothetical protein